MLRAKLHEREINLLQLTSSEIRLLKSQSGFTCPFCRQPMHLKVGARKRPHFAHMTNCTYEPYENESLEHLKAKNLLAGWLEKQGIAAHVEKPLPKISRIADIYFETNGKKYAIEIQKSAIKESLFKERTAAYGRDNIQVLWLFIGGLVQKSHSYILNRTMVLNRELPLMHLDVDKELLTTYHNIVWINTKEIQAQKDSRQLKFLTLEAVLQQPEQAPVLPSRESWLAQKQEFRLYKWPAYMEHDPMLRRQCQQLRTNLSLLPAEVGWPVIGSGFRKNIFIWQAYALLAITTYQVGDCFTVSQLGGRIRSLYRVNVDADCTSQLKQYLGWLVKFGVVAKEGSYYEYVSRPQFFQRLEMAVLADERLGLKALSPGGSWIPLAG